MKDYSFTVESKRKLTESVWEFVLRSEEKLPAIQCGQFLHLKIGGRFLLRRPFCIHQFSEYTVTLAIAVVGGGTAAIAELQVGAAVKAVLPIGNGFTLEPKHKRIVLLGGGVGCAPLATVPITYPDREYFAYLGFAKKDAVLFEQTFAAKCKTVVSTDDGSYGRKGFAIDSLAHDLAGVKPDVILTCGPVPMMKAVAKFSIEHDIPAYTSCEARMGCGVGACLVCTCAVKQGDGEVVNKRVCVDGPVFDLKEVLL